MDNSFFKFERSFYKQIQGLPMGNKISGILADVYLNAIEMRLIPQLSITFFARYVDDCMVLTTSRSEATRLHMCFNQANEYIQFELEHPTVDGKLSLLDFTLDISEGEPRFHPYMKPIRSDVFMAAQTALPTNTKFNSIANEWKRISNMCQDLSTRKREREKFIRKLRINGHTTIPYLSLNNFYNPRQCNDDRPIFYLTIPFISDQVDTMVRRCFRHLDYQIRISHKGTNTNNIINRQKRTPPTRNGKCNLPNCLMNNDLCYNSMVVYEAKCNACSKSYIGSTKKFLHTRVREHFIQKTSSVYKHNNICRGTWSFSIKMKSSSLQDLRWMEAIFINQEKPQINGKDDVMNLGPLLLM
jgi:predicted GIY-YIG superfamily endonuclease